MKPKELLEGRRGEGVGLRRLTDKIYYLPHDPELDRPMLAYVKGDKYALAIDAGYSASHVRSFYAALRACNFGEPDFTVITHWHYDHTFGLCAAEGVSIAHQKTNLFLREQKVKAQGRGYVDDLKESDAHFAKEYTGRNEVSIVLADLEFSNEIILNLGNLTARVFHTDSPHSEDTTCVLIPEEGVLFLGDSTSEDFFNGGYMDKAKLNRLILTIRSIDCKYCALSHCEPLEKDELLAYLDSIG